MARLQQAALLAGLTLTGRAYAYNCYYDVYNNYVCDGLTYGARTGIAAAIIIVVCLLLGGVLFVRRRRMQRLQMQAAQQGLQTNTNTNLPPSGYYQQPYGAPGAAGQPQPGYYGAPQPQGQYYYGPDAGNWQAPPQYEAPPATKGPQNRNSDATVVGDGPAVEDVNTKPASANYYGMSGHEQWSGNVQSYPAPQGPPPTDNTHRV